MTRRLFRFLFVVSSFGVGLGTSSYSQTDVEIVPRPASVAAKPGRLTGWGQLNATARLEDSIPGGWAAEGYVQVVCNDGLWQALHQDGWVWTSRDEGGRIVHPSPVVEIALAGGFWLHRLANGTVRTGGHDTCRPPPDGLSDVVDIAATNDVFLALREGGDLVYWHKVKEDAPTHRQRWEESGVPTTGIRAVEAGHYIIVLHFKDGTVRAIKPVVTSNSYSPEPGSAPLVAWAPGSHHFVGLSREGELETWGSAEKWSTVPADLKGPFVRVAAYQFHSYAQRPTGEWVFWGKAREGQDEVERLRSLQAFGIAGSNRATSNFVIGIAPSLVMELDPGFASAPTVREELARMAARHREAGQGVSRLEARYLEELGKLKRSAETRGLDELSKLVSEEEENFRDLERPRARQANLAKVQAVYRQRIPALLKQRKLEQVEVYEQGVDRFQALQDELTQSGRLAEAVEARRLREEMERALAILRTERKLGGGRLGPGEISPSRASLPSLAEQDRIFEMDDPVLPGELVSLGQWRNYPFEVPREATRTPYVRVLAGANNWIGIWGDGRFFCDSPPGYEQSFKMDAVPDEVRRLHSVFLPSDGRVGYFGVERGGKLVAWGGHGSWSQSLPEAALNWKDLEAVAVIQGGLHRYDQVLGLHRDGTVSAAGILYEQTQNQWKNPAAGSTDNVAVLAGNNWAAVMKQDGSVLAWNGSGPAKLPDQCSEVAKLGSEGGALDALRRDGTLISVNPSNWEPRSNDHPSGIADLVDFESGGGYFYALRADGRWFRWERGKRAVEEVAELRGVRRIAPGGSRNNHFVVGIRPPR